MSTPRPNMLEKIQLLIAWIVFQLFTSYVMLNVIICYVNIRRLS